MFREFDEFSERALKLPINSSELRFKIRKFFVIFLVMIFLAYIPITVKVLNRKPDTANYILGYVTVCQIVQANNLRLIVFMILIKERVKVVAKFKYNSSDDEAAKLVWSAMLNIHDIIKSVNQYFQPFLVQNLLLMYYSIVINIFWFSLRFFGYAFAGWIEAVAFIFPCFSIVLYLASCDREIRKDMCNIKSLVIELRSRHEEDFLIFMLDKRFHIGAFRFVNMSHSTLGKVS